MIIAGYQVQGKIYESKNSLVYRGRRDTESQAVILKVLKQPHPSPERVAWFKREYELTRSLHLEGVIKVYSLTTDQHRPTLVLEDFGGESLELHLKNRRRRFTLAELLPLAIQVADILGQVHQQHVIHKDVNPSNIVWSPQASQVKLIDFGISTVLTRENPILRNPKIGEGTLAYMSPEQTGRMNRDMDYRADLYSLGVSFYELLTGQLPFPTVDALELMHAHIAKQPPAPHEIIIDIPQPLSAIVMKLMAKNAEDRYQSVYGLKADLEKCLRQWEEKGQIAPFPLGRHDAANRFHIPQKLYGRESEIGTLLAAFERVSQGASEMMLVSGYAGIGKSTLVREVYKPITRRRGYFIAGKFDQFQRNIPYAPLAQAFRSLMRQILTESEEQIVVWREKLLAVLEPNSQVLIDLIPELALVIGPQPPVPVLPPAEAQNRLSLVFQNFIRVFAEADHPLVIFLDDLQWADAASLNLGRILMTALNNQYLFIIGAYRDNEVQATHPLMLTLDEIQKAGGIVKSIVLRPLSLASVNQLIADALNCTLSRARSLAELVLAKTNGNPFFVNEFLKSLYAEELLRFDFHGRTWHWDIAKIQARNITDNVIELMGGKLQKLGRQTQQVLKTAACIGNQFDLQTLATVYEHSVRDTAIDLWEALEEGLVLPLGSAYKLMDLDVEGLSAEVAVDYKFAHDRIQQTAYSLIPEAEKQIVHRQIGQLLLQNTPLDEREQKIFDIINQLNLGLECTTLQAERDQLIELNLLASRKAKAAAAYEAGLNYLQVALKLLSEGSWETQYDLTLAIHEEAAEAAYLSGEYVQMERLTEVVLRHANTLLDKVRVYEFNVEAGYVGQRRIMEGIKVGLEVLELLGVSLPQRPSSVDIMRSLEETQQALAEKKVEDLIALPEMTDPHKLASMRILMRLYSPAYVGSPELFHLINFNAVSLSVRHGNTPLSARAYASYGFFLCGIIGDIDTGYRFGNLALTLAEQFNAREIASSVTFLVNSFIRHWKEHIKTTLQPLLEAYQSGLETGAIEYAALSAFSYGFQSYWCGRELTELEREMAKYGAAIGQLKQGTVLHLNELFRQAILNLMGRVENPCRLKGESYDEEMTLPLLLEANNVNALCMVYLNKLILCYLFHNYPQALAHAITTEKYLQGAPGQSAIPVFFYYDSLARLAVLSDAQEPEQRNFLDKVVANQEKMQNWAQHAPMNFLHKFFLVEAERARVLGNDRDAREYYDQAIDLAREHGYVNEEAVANELAAKFYLTRGQERIAQHYLHDAHYAYTRWGALAKVKDLEARYPQFLIPIAPNALPVARGTFTSGAGQRLSHAFDFTSVLKASQAISGEIRLDKLLAMLMEIVIENAGAQRGLLLLEKEGQLKVAAERTIGQTETDQLLSLPVETYQKLPITIIHYVARTKEPLTLNDATQEDLFRTDPYITTKLPKSILCTPILSQNRLLGLIYLENNLATEAFTPDRLELVTLLSAQAAISLENADLYRSLETSKEQLENYSKTLELKVEQRTQELHNRNLALEHANEQVREANRRKSQFLAAMSHELRTPMNAIIGFTRLVLRRTGDLLPERQHENLVKVIESANQLLNLINQLLDLSRLEAGRMQVHPEWFDAKQLILACCELVSPLIKPGVYLQQAIADTVGEMHTDEEGLRHVILNLLSNAIKFTDSGEVVVRAWVNNGQVDGNTSLRIAVSDTGIGIPADALDTIFEEFQQVEGGVRKREGTGLGLPIAKRWVGLLGGSIVVESELKKGSTFTVTVPVTYRKS